MTQPLSSASIHETSEEKRSLYEKDLRQFSSILARDDPVVPIPRTPDFSVRRTTPPIIINPPEGDSRGQGSKGNTNGGYQYSTTNKPVDLGMEKSIYSLISPGLVSWPHSDDAFTQALIFKAEQERTKQEYYRLENKKHTLEILNKAIAYNIPPNSVALLFDDIAKNYHPAASAELRPRSKSTLEPEKRFSDEIRFTDTNRYTPKVLTVQTPYSVNRVGLAPSSIPHNVDLTMRSENQYTPTQNRQKNLSHINIPMAQKDNIPMQQSYSFFSPGNPESLQYDQIPTTMIPVDYQNQLLSPSARPVASMEVSPISVDPPISIINTPNQNIPMNNALQSTPILVSGTRNLTLNSTSQTSLMNTLPTSSYAAPVTETHLSVNRAQNAPGSPYNQGGNSPIQHIIQFHHWQPNKPRDRGSTSNTINSLSSTKKESSSSASSIGSHHYLDVLPEPECKRRRSMPNAPQIQTPNSTEINNNNNNNDDNNDNVLKPSVDSNVSSPTKVSHEMTPAAPAGTAQVRPGSTTSRKRFGHIRHRSDGSHLRGRDVVSDAFHRGLSFFQGGVKSEVKVSGKKPQNSTAIATQSHVGSSVGESGVDLLANTAAQQPRRLLEITSKNAPGQESSRFANDETIPNSNSEQSVIHKLDYSQRDEEAICLGTQPRPHKLDINFMMDES